MATDQDVRTHSGIDQRGPLIELATILSVALLRLKGGKSSTQLPDISELTLANGAFQSGYPTQNSGAARDVR